MALGLMYVLCKGTWTLREFLSCESLPQEGIDLTENLHLSLPALKANLFFSQDFLCADEAQPACTCKSRTCVAKHWAEDQNDVSGVPHKPM